MHNEEEDGNYNQTTDHAIKILYALLFLSCGNGGVEAARLLPLLGLPNDTTMESRTFPTIENRIGPTIRSLSEEIFVENIVEEVRLTIHACTRHLLSK